MGEHEQVANLVDHVVQYIVGDSIYQGLVAYLYSLRPINRFCTCTLCIGEDRLSGLVHAFKPVQCPGYSVHNSFSKSAPNFTSLLYIHYDYMNSF